MADIAKFLARIGMDPATPVTLDVDFLGRVQDACVRNIAYENIDILEGRPIDLTPAALYEKIVVQGRGGYCFELNGLLAYMLREMGFAVTERFSRYLRGEPEIPMRRHRIAVVKLPDGDYMCDIGVGQVAPRLPLKIEAGLVQPQKDETYRFERDEFHGWVLWDLHHGEWREYIAFSDDIAIDADFIQPCFFCEHHPESVFNKEPMIAIKTDAGRCTIDGRVYKEFTGEQLTHIEEDISDARMAELLETAFRMRSR